MQGETTGFAGESSGQGEEASSESLGGCHRLSHTEARGPASQVMGDEPDRQPGGVGGEAARLRARRSPGILENPGVSRFT